MSQPKVLAQELLDQLIAGELAVSKTGLLSTGETAYVSYHNADEGIEIRVRNQDVTKFWRFNVHTAEFTDITEQLLR